MLKHGHMGHNPAASRLLQNILKKKKTTMTTKKTSLSRNSRKLPKTIMEPEKDGSQQESLPGVHFQVSILVFAGVPAILK